MEISKFMASPLNKAVKFMNEQNLEYKLKEIKPPFKKKDNFETKGLKRVLKIEKKNSYYLITWSFQYNS